MQIAREAVRNWFSPEQRTGNWYPRTRYISASLAEHFVVQHCSSGLSDRRTLHYLPPKICRCCLQPFWIRSPLTLSGKKEEKTGGYADTGRGTWNHADGGPRAPQLTLIGGPSRAHRPNLVLQPQNTASLAEHRVGCELCLSLSRFWSFYLSIGISKAFEVLKIKMLICKAQKEVCLIAL